MRQYLDLLAAVLNEGEERVAHRHHGRVRVEHAGAGDERAQHGDAVGHVAAGARVGEDRRRHPRVREVVEGALDLRRVAPQRDDEDEVVGREVEELVDAHAAWRGRAVHELAHRAQHQADVQRQRVGEAPPEQEHPPRLGHVARRRLEGRDV